MTNSKCRWFEIIRPWISQCPFDPPNCTIQWLFRLITKRLWQLLDAFTVIFSFQNVCQFHLQLGRRKRIELNYFSNSKFFGFSCILKLSKAKRNELWLWLNMFQNVLTLCWSNANGMQIIGTPYQTASCVLNNPACVMNAFVFEWFKISDCGSHELTNTFFGKFAVNLESFWNFQRKW